jgi:GTPase SAR1 family protein
MFLLIPIVRDPFVPPLVLVANKCDLDDSQRQVSSEELRALARQWKCEFVETSAMENNNIETVFYVLSNQLLQHSKRDGQCSMM